MISKIFFNINVSKYKLFSLAFYQNMCHIICNGFRGLANTKYSINFMVYIHKKLCESSVNPSVLPCFHTQGAGTNIFISRGGGT